jgi:hypothetical protein
MIKQPLTLIFVFVLQFVLIPSLSAQQSVKLISECDYFNQKPASEIFIFPADNDMSALVKDILALAEAKANFELLASNVDVAASGFKGQERILLYDQYSFSSAESKSRKWINLAILAHQIGHHVNSHILSSEASTRREMELEADRFSAYILYKMGATVEEAAEALRSHKFFESSKLYPTLSSRIDAVIDVWNSAKALSDNYGPSVAAEVPRFQWPPPKPSAVADIPAKFLIDSRAGSTLSSAASNLEAALEAAGYSERSYYSVPDGFALVSRVERISETGESKEPYDRWSVDMKPPRVFSLRSYFGALFGNNPGKYRVIAFIITTQSLFASGVSPDFEVSKDWLWGGANKLPSSVKKLRFTQDYVCTALIYEFEQTSPHSAAVLKQPSSLTGRMHLEKAAIWQALNGSHIK